MEGIVALFVPILTIVSFFSYITIRYYLSSKERRYLIDRGLDAETIKALYQKPKNPDRKITYLKIGILSIAFGSGIVLGDIFEEIFNRSSIEAFMIFLMIGVGLIVNYYIETKIKETNNNNQENK